jgi:DNA polymerase-3 subunit gamma/tau
MQLHEEYRPTNWADVVGQDKLLDKLALLRQRGLAGRAFWLSGQSGTGKTTIARLIASEVADEFCIEEVDATDLTAARRREIERSMVTRGFGRGGRAYLVNESHGLAKPAIRQLLVMLERLPAHAVWCFTTTCEGQESLEDYDDASPLLSRCVRLDLSRRDLAKAFAERAKAIAERAGLDGRDLADYIKLAQRCRNNLRAMLQAVEAGEMVE